MPSSAQDLIAAFGLQVHPEGGYYRETYRSDRKLEGRSVSTAIYFLLPKGSKSRLHRLKSDELWHFHLGGPLVVCEIAPDGRVEETALGPDVRAGQRLQHVVRAGRWFGARLADGAEHALVGCTVAPGFEFDDFEMGDREALMRQYPAASKLIRELT